MVLINTFGSKVTTSTRHSIRIFRKRYDIEILDKCMMVEAARLKSLIKCLSSLLRNILVTLIRSEALRVKLIFHLNSVIYFFLGAGLSL